MSTFKDSMGREWRLEFDADLLSEVRDVAKVDLMKRDGSGFLLVENDEAALVAVLKVLCREQISTLKLDAKAFSRGIKREAFAEARTALEVAAADFFPPTAWSAMQSQLTKMRGLLEMAIQMEAIDNPMLPESMRFLLARKAAEGMEAAETSSTTGSNSPDNTSASGQGATQSTNTTDSPVNAESTQKG